MRGKLLRFLLRSKKRRITPADAGKTCRLPVAGITGWDHPRGCGENGLQISKFIGRLGSPPRMRGKHLDSVFRRCVCGITPADAGKTPTFVPAVVEVIGSPPRMRGKRRGGGELSGGDGITPADAGKTALP